MVLDQRTLSLLSEPVRLALGTKTAAATSALLAAVMQDATRCRAQLHKLSAYVARRQAQARHAAASEPLQNVLRKLPKLPSYAYELATRLEDGNIEVQEVVNLIQRDPALASFVLKTVNSAYYNLPEKITSVYHAVVFLGYSAVSQLVLTQALGSLVPREPAFDALYDHSLLISVLAHDIARLTKASNPLTASTIGLLHAVGELVLLLLQKKHHGAAELLTLVDEASVGASLLQAWQLPERIYRVIEEQHTPAFAPPVSLSHAFKEDAAILYLAHLCHDRLLQQAETPDTFLDEYLAVLNLPDFEAFWHTALLPSLRQQLKRLPERIRQLLQATPAP
ncbi:MAG: hypothetical protein KatS3mg131_0579 [Candidatus Tectimicrobiota bacterium]|nr:MAG: hypothetical protein KatS3mg131_0579 [Candidatus Tectomicrobia bacterium]